MIDLEEIERTINEIEHSRDTTFRACERLAWLYVCRDHLRPTEGSVMSTTALVPRMGGSDFLDAASGKDVESVLGIVDEHLQTIALMYPKTYTAILGRIKEL